jgi:hypothetical protein
MDGIMNYNENKNSLTRGSCDDDDTQFETKSNKTNAESPLIWKQGDTLSSTGSALARLAHTGYTREVHSIIGLSRTASLVGRDSAGGIPEVWDVMGNLKGANGVTRLMAVAGTSGSLSTQRAKALIRDHMADVKAKDIFMRNALHYALMASGRINLELIRVLVEAYPEGVQECSRFEYLPLHISCSNGASAEVLSLLIQYYPDAVKIKDRSGLLPLHILCDNNAHIDAIKVLINSHNEGVKEVDEYGDLPLHYACRRNASFEVIKLLIDSYPDGIKIRGKGRQIPLFWSCGRSAPIDVITLLIHAFPESAEGEEGHRIIRRHRRHSEIHHK